MIPATTAEQTTTTTSTSKGPQKKKKKKPRERRHVAHTLGLTADPWEMRRRHTAAAMAKDGSEEKQKIIVVGRPFWNNDREQGDIKKTSVISQLAVFAAVTVCRGRVWRQADYCTRSVMEDCLLIWLIVFMRAIRRPRYIHSFAARGKAAVFGSL